MPWKHRRRPPPRVTTVLPDGIVLALKGPGEVMTSRYYRCPLFQCAQDLGLHGSPLIGISVQVYDSEFQALLIYIGNETTN